MLQRALRADAGVTGGEYSADIGPFSRTKVHQATGMVQAQFGISADDTRMVIQGHAFANSRSMMDVARDVLDRRIDFSTPDADTDDPS